MADKWPLRILTLATWLLAGWSATYWALQFMGAQSPAAAPPAAPAPAATAEPTQVARLFGPAIEVRPPDTPAAAVVVVDPSTRFSLVGVVASRAQRGVALLSFEGQPARPYRVGSTIDNAFTLKSVSARAAVLVAADTGNSFTVNLAEPATGAGPVSPAAPAAAGAAGAATPGRVPGRPATAAVPVPGVPMPRFGPIPAASMGRRSS